MDEDVQSPVAEGPYQQLPDRDHIRLLKLKAGPPDQEYLSYSLETFLISDPSLPEYCALSYTWSTPVAPLDPDYSVGIEELEDDIDALLQVAQQISIEEAEEPMIFCNDEPMLVTSNLYDGLHRLAKVEDVEYIWCDALCINQGDNREKSLCIPLMGEIFASAGTVVVWLGGDSMYLNDFIWIHEAESMIEEAIDALEVNDWDCSMVLVSGGKDASENKDIMKRRWLSYFYFYARLRFFKRAWIMQEVALASDITVFCADRELSWDMMAAVALLMRNSGFNIAFEVLGEDGIPRNAIIPPLGDQLARMEHLKGQCSSGDVNNGAPDKILEEIMSLDCSTNPAQNAVGYFRHLVKWVRVFDATDPRDKIFSILGMVKRYLPPGVSMPIEADYSMSVEEIYTATTAKFVEDLPLLSALSMVEDKSERNLHKLPSWVPDFTQSEPFTQLVEVLCSRSFDCAKFVPSNPLPRHVSGFKLHLYGAYIDTVCETTPPSEVGQNSYQFKHPTVLVRLRSTLKLLTKRCRYRYFTDEDYLDILWKIRIAHVEPLSPTPEDRKNVDDLAESFRCWLVHLVTIPIDPLSDYVEVATDIFDLIKKLVTHGRPNNKWFRLQEDIARYGRAQWSKFMNEQNGPIKIGDWSDEDGNDLDGATDLPSSEDLTAMVKGKARATDQDPPDDEWERNAVLEDLPTEEIARAEWTELMRRQGEFSHNANASHHRLLFISSAAISHSPSSLPSSSFHASSEPFNRKCRHYLGYCPLSTHPGDQIWYLEGAAVPFILRPVKAEVKDIQDWDNGWADRGMKGKGKDKEESKIFELVGEAFVHGIMAGEVMDPKRGVRGGLEGICIV